MGKVLLISSPKGGVGKSVFARHLLVAARLAGIDAHGVDFDRQGTFMKWGTRRKDAVDAVPSLVTAPVRAAQLQDWRDGLSEADNVGLTIIDLPPSVEDHMAAFTGLADRADLILVPAQATQDDVDSVSPWVNVLGKQRRRLLVVLNRANRRTRSFAEHRGDLLEVADICPVEVPQLEDVHVPSRDGLTLFDFPKTRGHEPMKEVWNHVRRLMELP